LRRPNEQTVHTTALIERRWKGMARCRKSKIREEVVWKRNDKQTPSTFREGVFFQRSLGRA
jgi:hypothetical protein